MKPIRLFLFAALIVGTLAGEAKAAPPLGWPGDTWPCSVPTTFCLKLIASGSTPYALILEGQGNSNGGYSAASGAGIGFTTRAVSGTSLTAFSQTGLGFDVVSQLNNGINAATQSASKVAVFSQNTAGGTALIAATSGTTAGAAAVYAQNFNASSWAIYADGRTYAPGGIWTSSDRSLKKDIADSTVGLSAVLKLRPVTWAWKDAKRIGPLRGFVADEVATVLPEMVGDKVEEDGSVTKVIRVDALVPVLIKALQEEHQLVVALEARMAAIEGAVLPTSVPASPPGRRPALDVAPESQLLRGRVPALAHCEKFGTDGLETCW
jgi:hypothetical protein